MGTAVVRRAGPGDCEQLSRLRAALWPESPASDHALELAPILAGTIWNDALDDLRRRVEWKGVDWLP